MLINGTNPTLSNKHLYLCYSVYEAKHINVKVGKTIEYGSDRNANSLVISDQIDETIKNHSHKNLRQRIIVDLSKVYYDLGNKVPRMFNHHYDFSLSYFLSQQCVSYE